MSGWVKVLAVTLVFGIGSFLVTPMLWTPSPMVPEPNSSQLPFFILLGALESVVFGLGIAFILFGFPWVQRASSLSGTWTWLAYLSIAWQLVSWWPHDNLHMATGFDLDKLLGIEYGFHATLMLSAAILAYFFVATLRKAAASTSEKADTKKVRAA